jgi:hypothetical protein
MIGTVVVSGAAAGIALFGPLMFASEGDQREESRPARLAVRSAQRERLSQALALSSALGAHLRAALTAAVRSSARPSFGLARQTEGAD